MRKKIMESPTLAVLAIDSALGNSPHRELGNSNTQIMSGSFTCPNGATDSNGAAELSGSLLIAGNSFYCDFTDEPVNTATAAALPQMSGSSKAWERQHDQLPQPHVDRQVYHHRWRKPNQNLLADAMHRYKATAMALLASTLVLGCDNQASMEPEAFTQCVASFDKGDFARKDAFYADAQRRCWGQRWKVPRAYIERKPSPVNGEMLSLSVQTSDLLPGSLVDKKKSTLTTVNLEPIMHLGFSIHKEHTKKLGEEWGLRNSGRKMFEMDLYEPTRWTNEFTSAYLFSEKYPDLYVRCLLAPEKKIEQTPETATCSVFTHIDERIDVKYNISFHQMPELLKINTKLVTLLRSFALGNKTSSS